MSWIEVHESAADTLHWVVGKQNCHLDRFGVNLLYKLKFQPVSVRLQLLDLLDEDEIAKVFADRSKERCGHLMSILNSKPVWADSGEPFEFNDYVWIDLNISPSGAADVLKQLKKGTLKGIMLDSLEKFLTDPQQVRYSIDENTQLKLIEEDMEDVDL
jgi:hypothetical protein